MHVYFPRLLKFFARLFQKFNHGIVMLNCFAKMQTDCFLQQQDKSQGKTGIDWKHKQRSKKLLKLMHKLRVLTFKGPIT